MNNKHFPPAVPCPLTAAPLLTYATSARTSTSSTPPPLAPPTTNAATPSQAMEPQKRRGPAISAADTYQLYLSIPSSNTIAHASPLLTLQIPSLSTRSLLTLYLLSPSFPPAIIPAVSSIYLPLLLSLHQCRLPEASLC